MNQQVNITLAPSFGNLGQRVVRLTPESTSIPIGRSSKSISKNLLGAVNNAWFDSPVMSRKHAEMFFKFDSDDSTITIRDIGSMHGTHLNGRKLENNEKAQIHDGDVVVFGAEVKRGPAVFPACSFQVGLEFAPFNSSKSYCSPEMDDSSDAGISDIETDEREQVSSEDGISIESPIQNYKMFDSSQAIDLTEDASPAPVPSSDIVDLTDEPAPTAESTLESSPTEHLPSYTIELSDSDDQSEMEDLEDSEGSENSDESEGLEESNDEIIKDSTSDDMDISDEGHELDEDLSTIVRESAQNISPIDKLAEAMDEDDESDFGLSDAGVEGLEALFEDESVAVEDLPTSPGYPTTGAAFFAATFPDIPASASLATAPLPLDECSCEPLTYPGGAGALLYNKDNGATLPHRLPSPSDAAMVKTTPVRSDHQSSIQLQGHIIGLLPQTLGDKTGKHAFFEAREKNKVNASAVTEGKPEIIAQTSTPQQKSLFSGMGTRTNPPLSVDPPPVAATRPPVITPKWTAEASKYSTYENQAQFCTPSDSFSSLGEIPAVHCSTLQRATSPDYDMTSAHRFNESKNKLNRSRLSILDIIENSAREQSNPQVETRAGKKRKADEISDIQDEVRAWASSAISPVKSTTPTQKSILASSSTIEGRPTKKLKKLMEAAAYIAVGGVTVGAGVFFSLVATAPNFA